MKIQKVTPIIIKATLHFLGADMVGISRAPDWVWYSHTADGQVLKPAHKYAITTLSRPRA